MSEEQWDPKNCVCKPYRDQGDGLQVLSGVNQSGRWFVRDPNPDCPERGKRGHPERQD